MRGLAIALAAGATAAATAAAPLRARRVAPAVINSGYTGDQVCDQRVVTAVQQGVNVVIWSFIRFGADARGAPTVDTSDLAPVDCIANVSRTLADMGLPTTHMVSAGGWGAPHPVSTDPVATYAAFTTWNDGLAHAYGFSFDGVDWDIEGANEVSSPENRITPGCLDMVGRFSQLAKADGYLNSLVPPQSYYDMDGGGAFDGSLLHCYPNYQPTFCYHGWSAYAYIVSRYATSDAGAATFDWVAVQVYESFSRALYNISVLGTSPSDYLVRYVPQLVAGWTVDFSADPSVQWPTQHVSLNLTQVRCHPRAAAA
jgi:hypothetical protein